MISRWYILPATLFTRSLAALGGVLYSVVVARVGGTEGLGKFTVFISVLGILSLFVRRGQDMLLVRAVAGLETHRDTTHAVVLLKYAVMRTILPSFVLAFFGWGVMSSGWLGTPFPGALYAIFPALLLLTALALVAAYAKGLSRSWIAPLFEIGGAMLVAALLLAVWRTGQKILPLQSVMVSFLLALTLLALGVLPILRNDLQGVHQLPALTAQDRKQLCLGQWEFLLIALSGYVLQAGSFALAAPFLSPTELGLVRAAERLALLVSFSLLVISPIIMPKIVQLTKMGRRHELRRLMVKSLVMSSAIGGAALFPLLLFPEVALAFMGAEFVTADNYLRAMAVTQFFVAAFGLFSTVLDMSGHERLTMWVNVGSLALMLGLLPTLCVLFGVDGFVAAYVVVNALRSLLYGLSVWYFGL